MQRSMVFSSLGALLVCGCAYGPFQNHHGAREDGTGVSGKLVVEKREKSLLVAFDQTVCMVDAERYRGVRIRDVVWCNWRREGSRPAPPAATAGSPPATRAEPVAARSAKPARPTLRPRTADGSERAKSRD